MSKRKLLLADDSVTIQKVVNLTFADEGIEVIAVGDGDSAMEKVAEISPDLIMADVNMPGLTGYEICEKIRQDENLRRTPVILLVGSFEPFDEDEARRVGADDYLTKPFQSIRQLVNKVTVLLNSQNGDSGETSSDASSLEDTLEMDVPDLVAASQSAQYAETVQPVQYADTSFDDEMIQTNRPSNFSFDETQRFEARDTGKLGETPHYETAESSGLENSTDSEETISEELEQSNGITQEAEETESVSYEINEDASLYQEVEQNESSYQLETNDGSSYEIKDDVSEETENSEDVSFETSSIGNDENIELETNAVESELEDSGEPLAEEIKDDYEVETESFPEVSEEMVEEQTTSEEFEETESNPETASHEVEEEGDVLEDTKEYAFVADEDEIKEEIAADETAPEEESEELVTTESETEQEEVLIEKTSDEEIPLPEYASVLEFDDDDILQLPPIENDCDEEEVSVSETAPVATAAFVSTENTTAKTDSFQVSTELIDEIVAKVMERLSDKAIKEVAWEVVPQMTELIVTKMAEEKLKE